MQQKFFSIPFAEAGDQVPILNPVDPGGNVTFSQGWTPDYQADPDVNPNAKDIDRASTNYLMNVITDAIGALQAVGVPEWITAADNNGTSFPYAQGAHVRYSSNPGVAPWVFYVSAVDNNTSTPGAGANWQMELVYESTVPQALAGTNGTTIMTPRRVAAAVAQGITPLGVQVGMVAFFAAITVQTGYLPADGSIVSRTTYAALFAYMGTTFGAGDGSTTFQLPDMRGKFPRAWDNGAGIDPSRVFGSYIADSIKAHNHGVNDSGHNHTLINPAHSHAITDPTHFHTTFRDFIVNGTNQTGLGSQGAQIVSNPQTDSKATGITVNNATTAVSSTASTTGITTQDFGGTETAPKNVALLCCIKY